MPGKHTALLAVIGSCIAIFWPGALTFGFPGVMAPIWQEMFHVGTSRHRHDHLLYACCGGHFHVPGGPLAGALRHQEDDHSRHRSHRLQLCGRGICNFDLHGLRLGFSQWACLQLRLHSDLNPGSKVVPGEEGARHPEPSAWSLDWLPPLWHRYLERCWQLLATCP